MKADTAAMYEPLRARQAASARTRAWCALALSGAAVLFAGPGIADPPAADVFGRSVRLPAAPGMVLGPPDERYRGIPYFRYAPPDLIARLARGEISSMPFYATLMARPIENRDDATARKAIAEHRAQKPSYSNAVELNLWRGALKAGLAGGREPLPRAPGGILLLERSVDSPEALGNLVSMRTSGGDCVILGDGCVLVNGRALAFTVIHRSPKNESDLAQVHATMVAWIRDLRAANQGAVAR